MTEIRIIITRQQTLENDHKYKFNRPDNTTYYRLLPKIVNLMHFHSRFNKEGAVTRAARIAGYRYNNTIAIRLSFVWCFRKARIGIQTHRFPTNILHIHVETKTYRAQNFTVGNWNWVSGFIMMFFSGE